MLWATCIVVVSLFGQIFAEGSESIHVASWRWDEVGIFITLTLFTVLCGLARIAFHHAHWLSSRVPESCLMIVVGLTVGAIIFFSSDQFEGTYDEYLTNLIRATVTFPQFTPRTFFYILLPPVILESAYSLYDRAFANNVGTVLIFAVVGTILNIFSIGPLLYGLASIGAMGYVPFDLTLLDCLVFSTLIAAVDPVAVLTIFQEIGINKDLYYLVFGESLFNDAVTVVLYSTMVTLHGMPVITPDQYGIAVLAFLASSIGGTLIGMLFGFLTALITLATQENAIRVVEPLAVLGIAYLSYLMAELFHFSGILSIIACGLVQQHYALKNVSRKSHTTVIYFVKMLSATSEAIIFLFLGIVVVSEAHIWNTGFVMWSLVACFFLRFVFVYILTAMVNLFRTNRISLKEQVILGYGGLRGAIAFSLAQTIDVVAIPAKELFVMATLMVILFTVFVQGISIKSLVEWLSIKKESGFTRRMCEEINENLFSNVIAGIEEITGVRRDFVLQRAIDHIDEKYLQPIFLVKKPASDLTRLDTKLFLTDHFANLYTPRLGEEQRAELLRTGSVTLEGRTGSMRLEHRSGSFRADAEAGGGAVANGDVFTLTVPSGDMFTLTVPDEMEMRPVRSDTIRGHDALSPAEIPSIERLRRSFRNTPHEKFQDDDIFTDDRQDQIDQQLRQRHITARYIAELINNGQPITGEDENRVAVPRY